MNIRLSPEQVRKALDFKPDISREICDQCVEHLLDAQIAHLAGMAPEDALLKDEEINIDWDMVIGYPCQRKLITKSELESLLKAQLAAVWPIAEAKLQAERKKVLKKVGEWLDTSDFDFEIEDKIEALKSGHLPQEAKS